MTGKQAVIFLLAGFVALAGRGRLNVQGAEMPLAEAVVEKNNTIDISFEKPKYVDQEGRKWY